MSHDDRPPTPCPGSGRDAPSERARALVVGAFDLHVHIGPDVPPRRIDDVSLAHRCVELGLAGFALKSHYTSTAERAQVVSGVVPGVRVHRRDHAQPGRRRDERARGRDRRTRGRAHRLDADGRLAGRDRRAAPTRSRATRCLSGRSSSTSCAASGSASSPSTSPTTTGGVLPETRDVLRAIARHGLVLATAHLARDDAFAVVEAAFEEGVEHVVVTHPEFTSQRFSIEDQVALAERGCLIERCLSTPFSGKTTFEHVFDGVRAVGLERNFFSSDFGNPDYPAGRGRARDVGRPPARRGLRRGRDPRDDRRGITPGRRRMTPA